MTLRRLEGKGTAVGLERGFESKMRRGQTAYGASGGKAKLLP